MNIEKLKETIDSTEVVEELLILSSKVFDKSNDEAKKAIEWFISRSYLLGKRNMMKVIED